MRKSTKFIVIAGALAALAIPATASADVQRYQEQDATFTVTQPAGAVDQWGDVFTHDFKVAVNPCDSTFEGTGRITSEKWGVDIIEDVTGKFGNGTVSYVSKVDGSPFTGTLTDAITDGTAVNIAGYDDPAVTWDIEMKVSAPSFKNTSNYKNHGQYVKAMGGGDDAAHSCIGMPINSSK